MSTTENKPIRAIIVDDEELARQMLREFLSKHSEIEIVAECANGFEAVKAIAEMKPDLLFLDIQMPKLDGFEVLELVGNDQAVVFVTAYDEFAIRAFDIHAVDYLLKPFGADRFETALERVKKRMSRRLPPANELVSSARPPSRYLERVVVRDGTRVFIIPVSKLEYAEAQDDYVALSSQGKKHLKQQTLSSLEVSLDPEHFLRVHRSYIVNLDLVAKIEPYGKGNHVAILSGGSQLPVSRSGYARLREFLEERTRPPETSVS